MVYLEADKRAMDVHCALQWRHIIVNCVVEFQIIGYKFADKFV